MTIEEKLAKAMDLLDRAAERIADSPAPDERWWLDLFALTGQHMILTDEGWEPGESKQSYLDEWAKEPEYSNPILNEVNAPDTKERGDGK